MCRIRKGDCEALGALYDRYARPLYSLAFRILNNHCEAEETLQEVFDVIWQRAHSFDEALSKPFSWVLSITRRKAIDRLRLRKRRWRISGVSTDNTGVVEMSENIAAAENYFGDHLLLMLAAVNELPDEERQPIELAFFNGLIHVEIAAKLGEPVATIKSRICHGMLSLRQTLERRP